MPCLPQPASFAHIALTPGLPLTQCESSSAPHSTLETPGQSTQQPPIMAQVSACPALSPAAMWSLFDLHTTAQLSSAQLPCSPAPSAPNKSHGWVLHLTSRSTNSTTRKPPRPSPPTTRAASTKPSTSPSPSTASSGSCAPSSSAPPSRAARWPCTSSSPPPSSSSTSCSSVNRAPPCSPMAPSSAPARTSTPRA